MVDACLQSLALNVLHHQVAGANIVQRADVRMVQRGDRMGFAFETLTKVFRYDLDGDFAVQAGVTGFVHLAL